MYSLAPARLAPWAYLRWLQLAFPKARFSARPFGRSFGIKENRREITIRKEWKVRGGSVHWSELIGRGLLIYFFLILLLRATGKRQIGQMSPFDLVLLMVLSNAVQNSMVGGDNSVSAGLILAVTLVAANWIVGKVTTSSRTMEQLIEGSPQVLFHNGKIYEKILSEDQITRQELIAAVHKAGYNDLNEVRTAILENDGSISIIPKHH